jgi:hypothetical protein
MMYCMATGARAAAARAYFCGADEGRGAADDGPTQRRAKLQ